MRHLVTVLLLVSCASKNEDASTPSSPAPDLTAALAPGQVRAGVVTDEAALFGGVAAEGRPGDVKIYNDRVRFVIQGLRDGSYYIPQAGNVVDADLVRPPGQPGRDLVDEWVMMAGIGRLLAADTITVVNDGTNGEPAVVRASGWESPLQLIGGVVELPGLLPDLGLQISQEYVLAPDSWLLEVRTTFTATTETASFSPGDGILGSADGANTWRPGGGYDSTTVGDLTHAGWLGKRNEAFVGVGLPGGQAGSPGVFEAVAGLFEVAAVFGDTVTLEPGEAATYTRWYGVTPDPATFTDAMAAADGLTTKPITGVVDAPDGPVAGARVAVMIDGAPYTLAITKEDGSFSAQVPAGANATAIAEGRGDGWYWDHPEGAAPYTPYAGGPARAEALDSLASGAVAIPLAQGRGVASAEAPLTLAEPARLVIRAADGLPFETRVRFVGGDAPVDGRVVQGRPSGYAAAGASRDGELVLPVEAGTYDVLVHRGARWEAFTQVVELAAGQETTLDVALAPGFAHDGWMFGDPHCHGALSPDGGVAMEDRLVGQAGAGVQLHFGTDHDHIGDYRPLLAPLGLDGVLNTVVASEMSPVMRGHKNVYPLQAQLDLANGGAWRWWIESVATTTEEVEALRATYGGPLTEDGGFAVQINHPIGVGMGDIAHWSTGEIGRPDYWTDDFDAMEVLNSGVKDEYVALWLDLVTRGYRTVPVGVTDSHQPFSGDPGLNGTYFGLGTDDPTAYTDALLRDAMLAGRTVASLGPYLSMSIDPGSDVVGPQTLEVEARSASWVKVDRLILLRDGVEVETVEGTSAVFELAPEEDAVYVVVAEGDTPMAPVYPGDTPWAMANAIRVDVEGDGWTPPLAPLLLKDDGTDPPPPQPHTHD